MSLKINMLKKTPEKVESIYKLYKILKRHKLIYNDRKPLPGYLGRGRCEEEIKRGHDNENVHILDYSDGLMHMPKFIKLYTLKVCILLMTILPLLELFKRKISQ